MYEDVEGLTELTKEMAIEIEAALEKLGKRFGELIEEYKITVEKVASTMAAREPAYRMPCPTCGAEVNWLCRSLKTGDPMVRPHVSRLIGYPACPICGAEDGLPCKTTTGARKGAHCKLHRARLHSKLYSGEPVPDEKVAEPEEIEENVEPGWLEKHPERRVICPTCGAAAGTICFDQYGDTMEDSHGTRKAKNGRINWTEAVAKEMPV